MLSTFLLLLVVTYSNAQTISGESNPCLNDIERYSAYSNGSYVWRISPSGQLVGGSLSGSYVDIKWISTGGAGLSVVVQIGDPDCEEFLTIDKQKQIVRFPGDIGCSESRILLKRIVVQDNPLIISPDICVVAQYAPPPPENAPEQSIASLPCSTSNICIGGGISSSMCLQIPIDNGLQIQWESSIVNATSGFSVISGANGYCYYDAAQFTRDTWFRAKLTKGCATVYSRVHFVDVYDVSTGVITIGSLGADRQVCASGAMYPLASPLSSSVSIDFSYFKAEWFKSKDNGLTWNREYTRYYENPVSIVERNPNLSRQTGDVLFKLEASVCGRVYTSDTVKIHILNAGTIESGDSIICSTLNPEIINSTQDGSGCKTGVSYQWEISSTSATSGFAPISGATLKNYDPPSPLSSGNYWYRRKVVCTGCTVPIYSNAYSLTITTGELNLQINYAGSTCATAFSASYNTFEYFVTSYNWDFGDGNTSTEANPVHSYASPNAYTASLQINFVGDGCEDSATTQVIVQIVPESESYEDIVLSIPTTQIPEVLSASASSFADAWPLTYQDEALGAKNGFENGEQGVWRQSAGFVYNVPRSASASPDLAHDGSFTLDRFNWESADLDAIPGWQRVSTTTRYNSTGFEVESKDVLGNYSGALYGYYGQLPVAVSSNTNQTEMAFTGFEQDTHGNWNFDTGEKRILESYQAHGNLNMAIIKGDLETIEGYDSVTVFYVSLVSLNNKFTKGRKRVKILCVSEGNPGSGDIILTLSDIIKPHYWFGAVIYTKVIQGISNTVIQPTNVHTGLNSLQVSGDATTQQKIIRIEPGKTYILEGWASIGNVSLTEPVLAENLGITVNYKNKFGNPIGSANFISPTGTIIEGWQRFHTQVIIPENATSFDLTFSSGSAATAYFDDLRFYPADAVMQSYIYEPDTYRLSAQLDDNNYATFYYYDKEGKLFLIKKETVEGIKTLKESVNYTVKNN